MESIGARYHFSFVVTPQPSHTLHRLSMIISVQSRNSTTLFLHYSWLFNKKFFLLFLLKNKVFLMVVASGFENLIKFLIGLRARPLGH